MNAHSWSTGNSDEENNTQMSKNCTLNVGEGDADLLKIIVCAR